MSFNDTKYYSAAVWISPLTVAFLIAAIFYIFLIYKIKQAEKQNLTLALYSVSRNLLLRACLYQAGFMISWPAGFILWILFTIQRCFISNTAFLVVSVLWQLQGLFNAIIFSFTNRNFKGSWIFILFAPVILLPLFVIYMIRKFRNSKQENETEDEDNGTDKALINTAAT